MPIRYLLIILTLFISASVTAQGFLKGAVYESGSNNRLPNVFVRDNAAKQYTLTDKQGNFEIRTETGHLLIFDSPGYISDTCILLT